MEEQPQPSGLTARHRVRGGRTKQKQLITDEIKVEDLRANWTQCMFLMVHKRRLCNVSRCPESMYCGNHRPVEEGAGWRVLKEAANKHSDFARIPCPVDPTHSIYLHNLKSHTIRCTIRKGQDSMQFLPYYSQDCNSGEPMTSNLPPMEYCMEIGGTDNVHLMSLPNDNTSLDVSPAVPVCPDMLYEKITRCFRQMEIELGLRPCDSVLVDDSHKGTGEVLMSNGESNDDNYLLNDGAPCENDEMDEVQKDTHLLNDITHPLNHTLSLTHHHPPPSHICPPPPSLPHPLIPSPLSHIFSHPPLYLTHHHTGLSPLSFHSLPLTPFLSPPSSPLVGLC